MAARQEATDLVRADPDLTGVPALRRRGRGGRGRGPRRVPREVLTRRPLLPPSILPSGSRPHPTPRPARPVPGSLRPGTSHDPHRGRGGAGTTAGRPSVGHPAHVRPRAGVDVLGARARARRLARGAGARPVRRLRCPGAGGAQPGRRARAARRAGPRRRGRLPGQCPRRRTVRRGCPGRRRRAAGPGAPPADAHPPYALVLADPPYDLPAGRLADALDALARAGWVAATPSSWSSARRGRSRSGGRPALCRCATEGTGRPRFGTVALSPAGRRQGSCVERCAPGPSIR